MNKNKTFHPKLIIVDHFDEIKNQIDIKTETLHCNQNINLSYRQILNDRRQKQQETIDQIQELNLNKVNLMKKNSN